MTATVQPPLPDDLDRSVPPAPPDGPRAPGRIRTAFEGPGRPWILGAATLAGGAAAFFLMGAIGLFNIPFILRELPQGLGPAETSLGLTMLAFAFGFFLAQPLAIVRAFGPARWSRTVTATSPLGLKGRAANVLVRAAYGVATGYVAIIRGTPALVQILLVYYVFLFTEPTLVLFGESSAFWAGLVALTINTTGYQAEALRGGFQSVDRTQVDAGRSLGMSTVQIFGRVTLPQGLRLVTLPLANEWISTFKTSTLLSYITILELFGWARSSVAYYLGRPLEAFVILTIFYLAINITVSRSITYIEKRRRIPGLGSLAPELPLRPARRAA
ncbi:MAG: amino acid ABC transporter permease [Thermoplasmata archaeon]|nr:amino acid ABC transporter permease [Thermoplasmata archaeon]